MFDALAEHDSLFYFETRFLPTFARRYPRGFTFYVANPVRSILPSFVSFRMMTMRWPQ